MSKKLTLPDSFALARIIKKANLKPLFVDVSEHIIDGVVDNDKAIEFLADVMMQLSEESVENDIYMFLGGLFEMKPDEVMKLGFDELFDKFKEIGKENNLVNFISGVRKLMK